ncbi:hypothetical protein LCGC14_2281250, partial [marine sediment metagenome]
MDINKFTEMAQQALNESQLAAGEYGHQQIENEHLLLALLRQEKGVVPQILIKMNIDVSDVLSDTGRALERKPRVSGPGTGGALYLSAKMNTLLADAESEARALKDDFISTEHVFIALCADTG